MFRVYRASLALRAMALLLNAHSPSGSGVRMPSQALNPEALIPKP